ncbi:GGDEF domain-containing protein [Aureimonas frigidaquae]|uniref:Diguanylate cyclase n=1 Tax=Aureimonas frigidaquae TaxID=424757 RepID=A0A0P0Z3G9_9HYPH|nr:GGDEF domain-containing protein [Aureimonas frigidaquae]BAT28655.1 diguanylate cyclase [Aureimonas frigidaquae]
MSVCRRILSWFLKADDAAHDGITEDLLSSTASGVPVVAFGFVCLSLQVAVMAYRGVGPTIPLLILVSLVSTLRMLAMRRAERGMDSAAGVVATGIGWAAVGGLVSTLCVLSSDIVLSTVAALTVTGFAFTAAYNNAGIPRLARTQIMVVAVPFLVGCAMSATPSMSIMLLMGPIWLIGTLHLVGTAHRTLATQVTTRNNNHYLAHNDDLTGIANRPAILSRIDAIAAGGETEATPFVLYLDLDGFKGVNDTFGHVEGDHVLRTVARRFSAVVDRRGHIGRVGGDEFMVILPDPAEGEVERIIAELKSAARRPVSLKGNRQARIGVTIGSAPLGPGGADAAIALADARLYMGKRRVREGMSST